MAMLQLDSHFIQGQNETVTEIMQRIQMHYSLLYFIRIAFVIIILFQGNSWPNSQDECLCVSALQPLQHKACIDGTPDNSEAS